MKIQILNEIDTAERLLRCNVCTLKRTEKEKEYARVEII